MVWRQFASSVFFIRIVLTKAMSIIVFLIQNAFIDHGIAETTINEKVNDSYAHMEKLSSVGIDLAEITDTLLEDGVKAFADSFDNLLQNISYKRSMLSVS